MNNIAIYIRLSVADIETGISKIESESITNQRNLINNFLDNHKELRNYNRIELVDDGFSGINDNRPMFKRMIEMVKNGEINAICVKDFSRFFRDYIEAGEYLECIFPFYNVRFLSIGDNHDSNDYDGTTGGLEMVMRNIIYASYSKDLSQKIKSANTQMRKQGKFIGATPPYGYQISKTNRHQLVVDNEVAKNVKFIFESLIDGMSIKQIVNTLNKNNIATPMEYLQKNFSYYRGRNVKKTANMGWSTYALYNILNNYVYTGAMVGGKRQRTGIQSKQTIKGEQIVVENTHEAIVTKEEFSKAKSVIKKAKAKKEKVAESYPLKHLVKCGYCGYAMRKRVSTVQNYYICMHYMKNDNMTHHNKSKIIESDLELKVLNAIIQQINLVYYSAKDPISDTNSHNYAEACDILEQKIEQLKMSKLKSYEKFKADRLSKDSYLKDKKEVDKKIIELEKEIEMQNNLLDERGSNSEKNISLKNVATDFSSAKSLTYEMAHEFIESIHAYDNDNIEIKFKFKDIFENKNKHKQ